MEQHRGYTKQKQRWMQVSKVLHLTPVNVAKIDEYNTCFAWQAPTDVVGRV